MKTILFLFLLVAVAYADDIPTFTANQSFVTTSKNMFDTSITSGPTMIIRADGIVTINDKPIEQLSHPEIVEALKDIAESMRKNSMVSHFDRQTGFLLEELEKCQKRCGKEKK
jgi:hypothetical protein